MSFGENLISLRKQMGWSQDDLANNLNLSRQAISKWENDTSKPDIDNVKKISKIFSVTIDDLLNNEVPKEKAVALDVKKQEKKERTITIVKLMIIAVIVLYVISVIYKFASLLIIVNGVQKYANLSNYHYVITTYENNERKEKEECWFNNGVSKTVNTKYINDSNEEMIQTTYLDFNSDYGYIEENETKKSIDINEYLQTHRNFNLGSQLYYEFPFDIRTNSFFYILNESVDASIGTYSEKMIKIEIGDKFIELQKDTLLPQLFYTYDGDTKIATLKVYSVELNSVQEI